MTLVDLIIKLSQFWKTYIYNQFYLDHGIYKYIICE